ncbi:ribose 5-phosphate isomerase B [Ruminococcus sp.]|uniref:ribose 5-phosphate isomerase B n=1 Tax=Ruminococcus sp. TaxID=41978 RepID=UPI00261B8E57|nr:ribose 5-phosphate isomerase B [Ruminococcus sp.]MDD7555956.1 ribose 5-phosphate isomerase B [Ruminococcus sp.]MDY4964640.1 ribose 5-phosphate isomerase B [Ruminococcus callidus]
MIAIGCDHAGYALKQELLAHLYAKGVAYEDLGCDGTPCDYPRIAQAVCEKILRGDCECGILICGTGIGMSIAANKLPGIRASVCSDSFSTRYTRLHNDANVLCLGARVIGSGLALELADIFLETGFEGGRHQRRLDLITQLEAAQMKGVMDNGSTEN